MHVVQIALYVLGGLMMLLVLAGFFRSFWQPAPKPDEFRESGEGQLLRPNDGHGA